LADPRVKADKATIEKALTGFWRDDHLFELKQSWEMYQSYQAQIKACDEQIDTLLQQKVRETGTAALEYKAQKKKYRQKNSPTFKVETYAYQLSKGVDLLEIDGIGFDFVLTLLSEVGMDLKQFPSAKHFVSWLCLCPNKKVCPTRKRNCCNGNCQKIGNYCLQYARQRSALPAGRLRKISAKSNCKKI